MNGPTKISSRKRALHFNTRIWYLSISIIRRKWILGAMKKTLETYQIPVVRDIVARVHDDLDAIEDRRNWINPTEPLMLVEKMILILEDRRFFGHNGVDVKACIRAFLRMLTIQPHGGASTIDMQFVRTATGFRVQNISEEAV